MSTLSLRTSQPWSRSHEEDRRFRVILLQSLLISLVAGVITPYIPIPEPESASAGNLPPRRVRLLSAPRLTALRPPPTASVPAASAPRQRSVEPEQPAPARTATPRQKAARTGVLAMSDALAQLRGMTPKIEPQSAPRTTGSAGQGGTRQRSTLTQNVTRGSSGISGGVAYQAVVGAGDLPDREGGSGEDGSGGAVGLASATPSAASSSARLRSKEEIQQILDQNKGAMYMIYNRELRDDPDLKGKLVLSITIAPAGNVTRCVIISSQLGSDTLEQQLVALIKRIDFGNKPGVPAVTTRLPIEFFPQ